MLLNDGDVREFFLWHPFLNRKVRVGILLLSADKEGVCFEDKEIFLFAKGGTICICRAVCAELFDLLDLSVDLFDHNEFSGYRSCIQ